MKTLRKLIVFGGLVVLILAAAAWLSPITWIIDETQLSRQDISYSRINGTLWKGRAERVQYEDLILGEVAWDFQTFNQLRPLETTWRFDGKGADYELSLFVDAEGKEATDLRFIQGVIPAGWVDLSRVAPLLMLTGQFHLDLDHASPSGNKSNLASGTVHWTDAGLGGLADEPLGTIIMVLRSDGRSTIADIQSDPEADIRLDGQVKFNNSQYSSDLVLQAVEEKQYVLDQITGLGTRNEDGTLRIERSGRMPR